MGFSSLQILWRINSCLVCVHMSQKLAKHVDDSNSWKRICWSDTQRSSTGNLDYSCPNDDQKFLCHLISERLIQMCQSGMFTSSRVEPIRLLQEQQQLHFSSSSQNIFPNIDNMPNQPPDSASTSSNHQTSPLCPAALTRHLVVPISPIRWRMLQPIRSDRWPGRHGTEGGSWGAMGDHFHSWRGFYGKIPLQNYG